MAQEIELHRSLEHDNIVKFVSSFQGNYFYHVTCTSNLFQTRTTSLSYSKFARRNQ